MSTGFYRLGANARVQDGINPGNGKPMPDMEPRWDPLLRDPWSAESGAVGREVMPPYQEPHDLTSVPSPKDMGYTGDTCSNCQGTRMRNNGTCKVCDDCGTTTGCS